MCLCYIRWFSSLGPALKSLLYQLLASGMSSSPCLLCSTLSLLPPSLFSSVTFSPSLMSPVVFYMSSCHHSLHYNRCFNPFSHSHRSVHFPSVIHVCITHLHLLFPSPMSLSLIPIIFIHLSYLLLSVVINHFHLSCFCLFIHYCCLCRLISSIMSPWSFSISCFQHANLHHISQYSYSSLSHPSPSHSCLHLHRLMSPVRGLMSNHRWHHLLTQTMSHSTAMKFSGFVYIHSTLTYLRPLLPPLKHEWI